MKLIWYITRILPMSELRRVSLQRRLVERAFEADIRAAKASNDMDALEAASENRRFEIGMYDEEESFLIGRKLLAAAARLDVQPPAFDGELAEEAVDWEQGEYYGRWSLTHSGRAKLREELRKERKAGHEDRIRLLAWVTPLIGIAGIAATILTRK